MLSEYKTIAVVVMKKVALITGASSGIGMEMARIHAKAGGDLILVARRADILEKLRDELHLQYGTEVMLIPIDLTAPDAPQQVFDQVQAHGLQPMYLINNAGFGGTGLFYKRKWEDDRDMIQLNVVALSALCRLFIPQFINRHKGRILNVSSVASLMPGPLQAVYFATKAYVTSFSNALAEELKETGVTVTALLPGAVNTAFGKLSGMDKTALFRHPADAYQVAFDGYKGMLKGELNVLSGLNVVQKMSFPMMRFVPQRTLIKIVRKLQEDER